MAGELILIVEDNEPNRKVARDLLQVHGYRTIEAETGEDAIVLAATRAPDLVVMDVHLPGMSGVDALAKLRAAPATRAIPVLAFTASVMPQDRSQIMAAGFDAFMSKPIDLEAFLQTVADALGRRHAGGAP
jgi:two-component system cell cycle response regulator DivK